MVGLGVVGWFVYDFASALTTAIPEWNADGRKRGRVEDPLPGAVYSRVAPKYVEKYQDSGMKRDCSEAVWNRFKRKSVDVLTNPSIEEQRALVRVVASRGGEANVEAADTKGDWDFDGVMSADELAASEVRGKLKDFKRIFEDRGEAVPTSVLEVIELS